MDLRAPTPLVRKAKGKQDEAETDGLSGECRAVGRTSNHYDAIEFVVIAVLGVILIIALHLV